MFPLERHQGSLDDEYTFDLRSLYRKICEFASRLGRQQLSRKQLKAFYTGDFALMAARASMAARQDAEESCTNL
jgi:hypothetical protein